MKKRSLNKLRDILISEFGASASRAEELCAELSSDFDDALLGPTAPVPIVAPVLYKNRPNKAHTNDSQQFLMDHYGRWLGQSGERLYQSSLRRIDPGLMKALENLFCGRRDELASLLPPKRDEVTKRLGACSEALTTAQRKKELDRLRHSPKF